ncbi:MAG: type II toxin-antitoxin system prevent-host-death family antitoxin [Leptolyngbyaceae cyanobacterium]
MTWNIDEAQQRFPELLDAAVQNPQVIYQHNHPVAAVIRADLWQEFLSWKAQQQPQSLAQTFAEMRQLCTEEDYTFELSPRSDRPQSIRGSRAMTLLCDTNIISELCKPQPNQGVIAWSAEVTLLAISVITLEEIGYGLSAKPNTRIQKWFQAFLSTYCQILPITLEIAECAGELLGNLRTQGITCSPADIIIAATAQVHHLTLVTRNTRNFQNCSVQILNPFRE